MAEFAVGLNSARNGETDEVLPLAQVKGQQLSPPFPRLTYADAMERYGCDKPDTRYGLEMRTVSAAVAGSTFR